MSLDVTYGNITQAEADRLAGAVGYGDDHEPGSTEPWISQIVANLTVAIGARSVLETGCFVGRTSRWLYAALCNLGGGDLHLCDVDLARLERAVDLLAEDEEPEARVKIHPWPGDIITFLRATKLEFDLAWVDDDHDKKHVRRELQFLWPHMRPGGLILLHDVFGVCDLRTVVQEFGGYSIDLPRLGPAGGLGVIQIP